MPREDRVESLGLVLAEFNEVSPSAHFVSQHEVLPGLSKSCQFHRRVHLRLMLLDFLEKGVPPSEVELDFPSLHDVEVNEIEFLVILMSEVHGVSVPQFQVAALALRVMIG